MPIKFNEVLIKGNQKVDMPSVIKQLCNKMLIVVVLLTVWLLYTLNLYNVHTGI